MKFSALGLNLKKSESFWNSEMASYTELGGEAQHQEPMGSRLHLSIETCQHLPLL